MSTQHTPEPWRYDYELGYCGEIIGQTKVVCNFNEEPSDADASRIVACVNACAGIDDESLWILADNNRTLQMYISELEQQRDELLAALEKYGDHDKRCNKVCVARALNPPCDCGFNAAVAKARGKV